MGVLSDEPSRVGGRKFSALSRVSTRYKDAYVWDKMIGSLTSPFFGSFCVIKMKGKEGGGCTQLWKETKTASERGGGEKERNPAYKANVRDHSRKIYIYEFYL